MHGRAMGRCSFESVIPRTNESRILAIPSFVHVFNHRDDGSTSFLLSCQLKGTVTGSNRGDHDEGFKLQLWMLFVTVHSLVAFLIWRRQDSSEGRRSAGPDRLSSVKFLGWCASVPCSDATSPGEIPLGDSVVTRSKALLHSGPARFFPPRSMCPSLNAYGSGCGASVTKQGDLKVTMKSWRRKPKWHVTGGFLRFRCSRRTADRSTTQFRSTSLRALAIRWPAPPALATHTQHTLPVFFNQ